MRIAVDDLTSPETIAFLEQHVAQLRELGPPESTHALDLAGHARERGYRRLSLETGSTPFYAPARALYARHGFVGCEPFGSYRPDPLSVFMTLEL